jgi:EmrB/QacA subfamily drug resistance transporter
MNTNERVNRRYLLAIVLASYAMIVIDNSIVITGLPSIRQGLGFTVAGLSWVQNAYALAFGGLMMLGARAGDLLGRRLVFIVGLGIFSLASLAIGLATTPAWLISARAVQGVGAAILAPSTLALLSTSFPEGPERNRVLGWYGAVGGITASVGLVAGGIVADLVSWRAGFFINVPVGGLLIWGALRHVAETPRQRGRIDVAGAILSTLGVVAVVYGLVHAAEESWLHWGTAAPLGTGLVLIALFLLVERRAEQPILPLRLLASRERSGANVARVLFVGAAMGFFFYATQYLQGVLGMRPLWAGLAFFPSMLVNFLGALAAPRLVRRFGRNKVLVGALATSFAGMLWLGQVEAGTQFFVGVALPMVLVGVGMGATLALLTIAGVAGVPRQDAGSASGLVGVAHQLGGALGLALLVVVFAAAGGSAGALPVADLAHRIGMALTAAAVLLALALLVVSVFVIGWRKSADADAPRSA